MVAVALARANEHECSIGPSIRYTLQSETIHWCMVFEEKDERIGGCYQKLDQCSADVERIEYICIQTANEMKSN